MLINLKVKTLDAQTHDFSIDNEITVREFKDKIATKTNIAADNQRIIYCGRVLSDEKQVKEYDVDGKVLHVAERPPFSQRGPNSANNDIAPRARGPNRGMRNSPLFRALDGMVVGTMAIPVNAGAAGSNGQIQQIGNPFATSSSFCMNRITVARHMLECANNIAAFLENPEVGLNNTFLDILQRGRWTMESTVVEVGIASGEFPRNQNIVDMVQGAVTAALSRNGNGRNYTVLQLPTVYSNDDASAAALAGGGTGIGTTAASTATNDSANSTPGVVRAASDIDDDDDDEATTTAATVIIEDVLDPDDDLLSEPGDGDGEGAGSASNLSTNGTTAANADEGSVAGTADNGDNASAADNNNEGDRTGGRRRRTGTDVLASVISQMREVQTRLSPFIDQYYDLLLNEPTFEENDTVGPANAQRLYDHVSEAFHYLSHAQHAISDLMLNVSQPTPRFLTCRPILVEQSGYISSNNMVSPQIMNSIRQQHQLQQQQEQQARDSHRRDYLLQRLGQTRQRSPASVIAATAAASPFPTTTTANSRPSTTATDERVEDPVDEPITAPPNGTQPNNSQPLQMARLIEAVVNSAPVNAEFHVQINAPSVMTIGMPMNGNAPAGPINLQLGRASLNNGQQPTQQTTVPAAVAAANNNNNNNTTTSGNTPTTTASGAGGGTDINQASVTTVTLPTTSTQTRSTTRPQIQLGQGPTNASVGGTSGNPWNGRFVPSNMVSSFDRFLPCNSHHIRQPENVNGTHETATGPTGAGTNTDTGTGEGAGNNTNPFLNAGDGTGNNTNPFLNSATTNVRRFNRRFALPPFARRHNHRTVANAGVTATLPERNLRSGAGGASGNGAAAGLTGGVNISGLGAVGMNIGANRSANNPRSGGRLTLNVDNWESDMLSDEHRYNLRNQLRKFLNRILFENAPINATTIPNAINRAVTWFDEFLTYLPQFERPGYNSRASICNVLREMLPWFIRLFDDSSIPNIGAFIHELKNVCKRFMNRLYSVLVTCIGQQNTELYWGVLVGSLFEKIQSFFTAEALQFLNLYVNQTPPAASTFDADDATQFIVKNAITTNNTESSPMETDIEMTEVASTSTTTATANTEMTTASGTELPNVRVGSEPWHRNFPSDWLPIITRDMQTQAENPPAQPPFSDAYISGMSAKRRKIIQSNKSPTDVESLVADSVRRAFQNVGVGSSTSTNDNQTTDDITSAIARDSGVQTSYTEAVRNSVRDRLKKEPDFKPEKYPQTNKFINKQL